MWASLKQRKAPRGNPEAAALKRWSVRAPLKQRKAPRGNPEAAALKRWSVSEASPQRAEGRTLLSQRVQPRNSTFASRILTLKLTVEL